MVIKNIQKSKPRLLITYTELNDELAYGTRVSAVVQGVCTSKRPMAGAIEHTLYAS